MPSFEIVDLMRREDLVDTVVGWVDAEWGAFSGRTREQTQTVLLPRSTEQQLPLTLVCVANDQCMGVATLRVRDSVDWLPGASPWVCNVFVPAPFRGRGIATALCAGLEPVARSRGFKNLFLVSTRPDSLYHALGYAQIGSVTRDSRTMLIMKKSIAGTVTEAT